MLPYRQSDQLDFHISNGLLGGVDFGRDNSKSEEVLKKVKVVQNYFYVASTTAINNAAASQLLTIN